MKNLGKNLFIGAALMAVAGLSTTASAAAETEKCYGLTKDGKQMARTLTDDPNDDPRLPGVSQSSRKILPSNQDVAQVILPEGQQVADDERPSSWDYGHAKAKNNQQVADDDGVDPHTWDGYGNAKVKGTREVASDDTLGGGIGDGAYAEVPKGNCARQGGSLKPME